jgi:N-acetylmuramoyl-L-alanine amidase
MTYNRVVISSGHSTKCQGAVGILNEVQEATRVVDRVGNELRHRGVDAVVFHDTVSTSQNENLNRIVDFHNSKVRDLDISVHFNAHQTTSKPMGTEVLYLTQSALADRVSKAIADAGDFINRGAKKRTDLFFLNNTAMPAILIEVCFVDSEADCTNYKAFFDLICESISDTIGGESTDTAPPPQTQALFHAEGKVSWFGGPDDTGVSDTEGLAFIHDVMDAPQLFLPEGTPGTEGKGLARRLNPFVKYLACRFDYSVTSKKMLAGGQVALVRNPVTGVALTAFPADWGPNENTGRVADLSPQLLVDLGLETDDEAEVVYPWPADTVA